MLYYKILITILNSHLTQIALLETNTLNIL